ncbi:alpha/beta hydrolase-fold protein [Pseudoxanthomonas sangjuensis]
MVMVDTQASALAKRAALLLLLSLPAFAAVAANPVQVRLDASMAQPAAGRLLVFAIPAAEAEAMAKDGKVDKVDASLSRPTLVSVAATEVAHLAPGGAVALDTDALAFPAGFSALPKGDYYLQAVLDRNHDYNYGGRGAGDLVSKVVATRLPAKKPPVLSLDETLPARGGPWQMPAQAMSEATKKHLDAAREHAKPFAFASPALAAFWGREVRMRGWVLLPPDYATGEGRYPTVYFTHGFGGNFDRLSASAAMYYGAMAEGQIPPMVWVFLDESGPTGTHEFADSVNNGPWGRALTEELIPWLETQYRMDGKPSGRFLTGHSSGGWATLWLQVAYPKLFGGTWSTSPDSSDFRDFTGPDIYAANANVYRKPDGSAYPLVRGDGKVMATFEQFARLERVLGEYGGQMASFDWVFSPRGADGRPQPMFDRDSGAVDPQVAAYWREHYDIAYRLKTQWPALKPDLDGKIHVIVGDADTFYLDGAARRLKEVLDGLGAKAEVRFVPGRSHFDLYAEGDDRQALAKRIAWEMWAVARPGSALRPPVRTQPEAGAAH